MMARWNGVLAFAFLASAMVLSSASRSAAQSNECLLEIHDGTGAVVPSTLCQQATTTDKSCVFDLQLCLNEPGEGCTPANFTKKQFRAQGHCGPVGKLRVQTAGSATMCGDITPIRIRTKQSGKKPGKCMIRAAVQSSATHARTDVDTVKLVCNPVSIPCPSTTTTTSTTTLPPTTTTL
jgi:hypothetical protein